MLTITFSAKDFTTDLNVEDYSSDIIIGTKSSADISVPRSQFPLWQPEALKIILKDKPCYLVKINKTSILQNDENISFDKIPLLPGKYNMHLNGTRFSLKISEASSDFQTI